MSICLLPYQCTPQPILLRRPRPRHPSSNNTRQLLRTHTPQHANSTRDQRRHRDAEARKEEERHANVLLLARQAAPLHALGRAVVVEAHDGAAAAAGVAARVLLAAGPVARAGVCGVGAGAVAAEADREEDARAEFGGAGGDGGV